MWPLNAPFLLRYIVWCITSCIKKSKFVFRIIIWCFMYQYLTEDPSYPWTRVIICKESFQLPVIKKLLHTLFSTEIETRNIRFFVFFLLDHNNKQHFDCLVGYNLGWLSKSSKCCLDQICKGWACMFECSWSGLYNSWIIVIFRVNTVKLSISGESGLLSSRAQNKGCSMDNVRLAGPNIHLLIMLTLWRKH